MKQCPRRAQGDHATRRSDLDSDDLAVGHVSPLPVFTLTENTATTQLRRHAIGDTVTLSSSILLHQEVIARERSRHRGRVDKIALVMTPSPDERGPNGQVVERVELSVRRQRTLIGRRVAVPATSVALHSGVALVRR